MAVTYGFFNSINGDRTYNADQISNYFLKLISNGVFATPSNAMQVVAGTGLNVNVSAGWGFINCKWINNDALYSLQLDAADIVLDRIDRIVLHLDNSTATRSISIQVSKGTPGSTPLPPALVRSGDVYELSLAKIYVAANATAITQADITDERADTSVCGYVTGLIDQIDTTNLFAQFTAAFNAWFDDVKEQVKAQRYCLLTASGRFCVSFCLNAHNHFIDNHSCHKCSDMIVPHNFYIINTNSVGFCRMVGVLCFPKNLYY